MARMEGTVRNLPYYAAALALVILAVTFFVKWTMFTGTGAAPRRVSTLLNEHFRQPVERTERLAADGLKLPLLQPRL